MKKNQFAIILIISSTLLTGCMTTPAISPENRPHNWGHLIDQKNNFYKISENVFRSEQPDAEMIAELQQQNINIVINLRNHNQDKKVFLNYPIQLVHIPINTWAINRQDLLKVMQTIQSAQKKQQKVLIHCYHGSDRTGASIAMYRIIFENWTTADALNEMKHGGYGFHPIWGNIENLFSPENIRWIREQLTNPSYKSGLND
ncbi:dual specificity protein phosphatase family protein [Acinetobacter silvestris]|uniref:Protein tyrosine phosphatase n=1 Tax=Acinetobacter silvestris TaxID=1977882 RepID=A0A1Y3C830_9GAMM|nr:dual specificity protein phosphatase family protein [Acinetobacter silvestris]OTG63159.1 protein tyrosine phosphatase [Acinetobacter silvestris]